VAGHRIALKGLGVLATPSFAFGSFNGLTFAFFCNSGLMFDMPTTAFLSFSHSPSVFVRSASHS